MNNSLPLAEAIKELRAELNQARTEGQDEAIRFTVEEVEITLQVVAAKEGNTKAGFKVPVIDLDVGAGGKLSNTKTHTLRLKMSVSDRNASQAAPVDGDQEQTDGKAPLEIADDGRQEPAASQNTARRDEKGANETLM
ncbi:MAG: hypothetical protein HQL50_03745 [Magnetococcales bacterium]|nr:hypothetical protein [Magnetococcales bacterium]